MAETDTIPVEYRVLGWERGIGALLALATVEVDIGGVVLTLQGVGLWRRADGGTEVRMPRMRRPNGEWRSAIVVPHALGEAIGVEVTAAVAAGK